MKIIMISARRRYASEQPPGRAALSESQTYFHDFLSRKS